MWCKGVKGNGEKGRAIERGRRQTSHVFTHGFILFILMSYIIKAEGENLGKGMGPPGVRRENKKQIQPKDCLKETHNDITFPHIQNDSK